MEFLIKDLKISSLDQEIFGFSRKKINLVLYKLIKSGNFNVDGAVKVRKVKRTAYEVIVGVDVFEVLQLIAAELTYPENPKLKINCEVVDSPDKEAAITLMLHEAVNTPSAYASYSEFQMYFFARLYTKFSGKRMLRESIQNSIDIEKTSFQNLQTCVNFTVSQLKIKYAGKYSELVEKYKGDKIYENLTELKLIEYAIKQNEWTEFCDFFHGKMKIGPFYSKVYNKNKALKSNEEKEEKSEKVYEKAKGLLLDMKSLFADFDELTVVERHTLHKSYGRDLQYFLSLITPDKPARKTVKSAEKMVDGELFEN